MRESSIYMCMLLLYAGSEKLPKKVRANMKELHQAELPQSKDSNACLRIEIAYSPQINEFDGCNKWRRFTWLCLLERLLVRCFTFDSWTTLPLEP